MNTFLALLKKEIRELVTWQLILPLLITGILFFGLGSVIGKEQEKAQQEQPVVLLDRDKSPASGVLADTLKQAHFKVITATSEQPADLVTQAKQEKAQLIVSVPPGFGDGIAKGQQQSLDTYAVMSSFSFVANQSTSVMDAAVGALNTYFGEQLITQHTGLNPAAIREPITNEQHIAVGDRIAAGNVAAILGFISSQTTFIPIIFFFVLMSAAQMIATAVASEKENKTIETLLTMPISRRQIVSAKMLAAGLVALAMSAVYVLGFRKYMDGLTGGTLGTANASVQETARQLGLVLTPQNYLVLGLSLFLGILVALAIAMILGAFAEDVKAVQGLITPLMVLLMIPYVLTLFLDVSTLSPGSRYAVYAIPFTHSFLAAPNLFLHRTQALVGGIIYQFICFLVFVSIAAKIFTTDRIVNLKLNFGKKRPV